ncbi:hypothetical protein D3C81_1733380 [compost metagenome]
MRVLPRIVLSVSMFIAPRRSVKRGSPSAACTVAVLNRPSANAQGASTGMKRRLCIVFAFVLRESKDHRGSHVLSA